MKRRGHALRRRYGRAVATFGTRVRIRGTREVGRIERYVPFDKYYVKLDKGGHVLAYERDLEKR